MPRRGLSPSYLRTSVEFAGTQWWIFDHAFNEIKAGPFNSRSEAQAALQILKSKRKSQRKQAQQRILGKTQRSHNPGQGRGFIFFGSATSKLAARKIEAKHPGSFIHEEGGRYYILKAKKGAVVTRMHGRSNPTAVPIYGQLLRIEAKKTWEHEYGGKRSAPGQKYFHDFSTKGVMVYGLPDGSLLIKSKKN